MSGFAISRRRFLTGASVGTASLALGGCDAFDSYLSSDSKVRQTLERANDLSYRVQRLLQGRDALAQEFSAADIRQPQRPNGITSPDDEAYNALLTNGFADWRLEVSGLVQRPLSLSLTQLQSMPSRTQITRHDCVEGWSAIAQWQGARLSALLDVVKPAATAKYVVFHCADPMEEGGQSPYYESIDMDDAYHEQTLLAYALNGQPLPIANGAPIRLRVERQLGYKHAKYVMRLELVESFAHIAGGKGGYWEDQGYQWYAGI